MKRYISAQKDSSSSGTSFYQFQLKDLIEYLREDSIILSTLLEENGLDALDISHMYGSFVDGDVLYVCKTDGEPIYFDGEEIDPESAHEDVLHDKIFDSEYLKVGTKEDAEDLITRYEFLPFNKDKVADVLIKEKGFKFSEVESALKEFED